MLLSDCNSRLKLATREKYFNDAQKIFKIQPTFLGRPNQDHCAAMWGTAAQTVRELQETDPLKNAPASVPPRSHRA